MKDSLKIACAKGVALGYVAVAFILLVVVWLASRWMYLEFIETATLRVLEVLREQKVIP